MTNPYTTTQAILDKIVARLNAGTPTSEDLLLLSKGLAALQGNADLQAIVAGMLQASTDALSGAATTATAALAGVPTSIAALDRRSLQDTTAIGHMGLGGAFLNATYAAGSGTGNQSSTFARPWVVDRRTRRTYVSNALFVANNVGSKVEWGYFDQAWNWTVIDALASSVSTTAGADGPISVPLMNAAGTSLVICQVMFPYAANAAIALRSYDGAIATGYTVAPNRATAARSAWVYDLQSRCLITHDDTNYIRVHADNKVVDTGRPVGAFTIAGWAAQFGDNTRYVDLSMNVEPNRAGDKRPTPGYVINQNVNSTIWTNPTGSVGPAQTGMNWASQNGFIGWLPNVAPGAAGFGHAVPFFVVNGDGSVEIWRCAWSASWETHLVPVGIGANGAGATGTIATLFNVASIPCITGLRVRLEDAGGITRARLTVPVTRVPAIVGEGMYWTINQERIANHFQGSAIRDWHIFAADPFGGMLGYRFQRSGSNCWDSSANQYSRSDTYGAICRY